MTFETLILPSYTVDLSMEPHGLVEGPQKMGSNSVGGDIRSHGNVSGVWLSSVENDLSRQSFLVPHHAGKKFQ